MPIRRSAKETAKEKPSGPPVLKSEGFLQKYSVNEPLLGTKSEASKQMRREGKRGKGVGQADVVILRVWTCKQLRTRAGKAMPFQTFEHGRLADSARKAKESKLKTLQERR